MRTFRFVVLGLVGWISATFASGAEPAPKVVVAWAVGPMEARVAFDRAVDPEVARRVVGESIGFGEGEKPGVVGRPGGDRGALRVAAAKLVDDGRTLVLITDPHPREATYRLTLPVVKGSSEAGGGEAGPRWLMTWAESMRAGPRWGGRSRRGRDGGRWSTRAPSGRSRRGRSSRNGSGP